MKRQMRDLVRNPFGTRFMREAYDSAVDAYDTGHRNLFTGSGDRKTGNSWSTHFWRGFDGLAAERWDRESKKSSGYAFWRAGNDIRKAILKLEAEKPVETPEEASPPRP